MMQQKVGTGKTSFEGLFLKPTNAKVTFQTLSHFLYHDYPIVVLKNQKWFGIIEPQLKLLLRLDYSHLNDARPRKRL